LLQSGAAPAHRHRDAERIEAVRAGATREQQFGRLVDERRDRPTEAGSGMTNTKRPQASVS
jgi:hypothetical protein